MKFTKESQKLMSFFANNNCLLLLKQTNKTDTLLKTLYQEIIDGVSYIQSLKTKNGESFYKLKINHITNVTQIQKPTTFPSNAFPTEIINHINEHSLNTLTYSFYLFEMRI